MASAVALLAALFAGSASAEPPGYSLNPDVTITVASSTVEPGQSLPVGGNGWLAGSEVSIWVESTPQLLKSGVQVDSSGSFSTSVVIPSDLTPGPHTVFATGTTSSGEAGSAAAASITVPGEAAGAPTSGSESLSNTGAGVLPAVAIAAALILAGGLLVTLVRRRRAAV